MARFPAGAPGRVRFLVFLVSRIPRAPPSKPAMVPVGVSHHVPLTLTLCPCSSRAPCEDTEPTGESRTLHICQLMGGLTAVCSFRPLGQVTQHSHSAQIRSSHVWGFHSFFSFFFF